MGTTAFISLLVVLFAVLVMLSGVLTYGYICQPFDKIQDEEDVSYAPIMDEVGASMERKRRSRSWWSSFLQGFADRAVPCR